MIAAENTSVRGRLSQLMSAWPVRSFMPMLIGPALALVIWVAGSFSGRDAEQLVHTSPATVYAALENMVAGSNERSATLTREGGSKVPAALAFAAKDADKSANGAG